jgi:CBS domain containing-hemolysin-like protein
LTIDEGTYTTLGGYVLGRLGRRARVGDMIDCEGRPLRVESLDGLRVERVWLSKPVTTRDARDSKDAKEGNA